MDFTEIALNRVTRLGRKFQEMSEEMLNRKLTGHRKLSLQPIPVLFKQLKAAKDKREKTLLIYIFSHFEAFISVADRKNYLLINFLSNFLLKAVYFN